MNGIILILSLIVIGYIYQTQNEVTKFKITKMPAHQVYYKSAIIGFYFFLCGALVLLFFLFYFSICEYKLEKNFLENIFLNIPKLPTLQIYWILSFFIAFFFLIIVIFAKNRYLLRGLNKLTDINEIYALTLSDPLDKLLNDSAFLSKDNFLDKIIMLTMNDKKVYVGTVLADTDIFNRFLYGSNDFIFCPIYSGYRHKDSLEVIFTTNYFFENPKIDKKFQIILNKNNIISATKVDLDTLLNFTDKDENLNKLRELSLKSYPILINMKNKNIYIGYISESFFQFNSIRDVDFISLKLMFHMVFEKDKINVKQYYDYSVNIEDLYIKINFKEIESILYKNNPEKIWLNGDRINAEMLMNMFNYKLIDL
ncbi:hypothetical protein [Acinetobacter sp.]|jgi:hypothetical protein|uniref:hypothetical protein n=1 Tax=Acinetobacter sp. TaxID=472 RepID=UPI0028270B21|nr:hypothetical protein [Acinetobacter sp.]MDR0235963.1 hypothetical protein [Acinetobacter sp.]